MHLPKDEQEFEEQTYPKESQETSSPETSPQEDLDKYPMPKKEVMKIDGTAVEYLILVPKGMKPEYPKPSEDSKPSKPKDENPTDDKLKEEKDKLENELKKAREELSKIREAEKQKLAMSIVETRIEKGLTTKDDQEKKVEELSKLPKEQLEVLLEDCKCLSKVESKPRPKSGGQTEKDLSEEESKKRELRKKMFGHEEPVKEHLKSLSENAGVN